jgi:hypothetical protein
VKTPDPSSEPLRRTFQSVSGPGPRPAEEYDERLRYVSLPTRRSHDHGTRNLVTGVALLIVSVLLMGEAIYLAGPAAAYTVGVAVATAVALYVVARLRLLRQRNGNFLAGAIVCLLAVSCVLVQGVWQRLVQHPEAVVAGASESKSDATTAAAAPSPASLPPLIETYKPARVELEAGQVAEVVRPYKVNFDGKSWLLRAGDVFPVNTVAGGKVTLGIGVEEITVPASMVKVKEPLAAEPEPAEKNPARAPGKTEVAATGPTATETAKLTEASQREAVRRYPGLAVEGSPENQSFREMVSELKVSGRAHFFDDPEWPVRLAEILASREGWVDADGKRKGPKNTVLPDDRPAGTAAAPTFPEDSAPAPEKETSAVDKEPSASPAGEKRASDDEAPLPRAASSREIAEPQ